MVWYGMVWYGMVWYGMVWYGMVWYSMVYVRYLKPEIERGDTPPTLALVSGKVISFLGWF